MVLAIRFTIRDSANAYLTPIATHFAGTASDPTRLDIPPMGLRLRLNSSYNCNGLATSEANVICVALMKYGLILADNGSNWYVSGTPDPRWLDSAISVITNIPGSAFEAVNTGAKLCTVSDCSN